MNLDFSRCRIPPFRHQIEDVAALVRSPFFGIFSEMGTGKTKIVIDAAQFMFEGNTLDRVLIVAPAAVRSVWYDQDLGELARHLFVPSRIVEFHTKVREWKYLPGDTEGSRRLVWIITNYDYITSKARLAQLLTVCGPKTLLVLDESAAIKNAKTQRTVACMTLRGACGRVVLMNGTPISNHIGDMFSQSNMMSRGILNCPSYTQFCARYALMKPILGPGGRPLTSKRGFVIKKPDSWIHVEDLQQRLAPYVVRRLKSECLDLPAKLRSIPMTARLTPATWAIYKAMRDDLVAWLSDSAVSMAPQVITKIMRLAQVTSGFLGGIEDMPISELEKLEASLEDMFLERSPLPDLMAQVTLAATTRVKEVKEIGREKLNVFLDWVEARLEEDPNIKILAWGRFRPEIIRAEREVYARWPNIKTGIIIGGQTPTERDAATHLLDPRSAPDGPVVVIGNPASGGKGLNLTACHTVIYLSNDYSLEKRLQSEDRVHRAGQTWPVSYADIIAIGPNGQKTVDHTTLAALTAKDELASMTVAAWIKILTED